MPDWKIFGFAGHHLKKTIRSWLGDPLLGALAASCILAIIILPYWWLAVLWSETVISSPSVQFTFVTTSFLLTLIVIDSVFIIRYYQIFHRIEYHIKTEELRKSEENYRYLIDFAPFPVVIIRACDHTIIMINQRTAELFSIDPGSVIGKGVQGFYVNLKDREFVLKSLRESGRVNNYELEMNKSNGMTFWASLSANNIRYLGENALFVALIDVTEKKNLEEAIKKSEELYRSIVTASPDAIVFSDLTGIITMIPPAAIAMFGGQSPDDFIGHNVLEFIHPDDAPVARQKMIDLISGKRLHLNQYRGQRVDKSYFPYEIHSELTCDDEGHPTGIVYVIRDITLRVEAEEALRENEERFTTIFQEVPDPLLILDISGIIQDVNLAGFTLMQLKKQQIVGISLSKLRFFPEENFDQLFVFIFEQTSHEPIQTQIHLPDGTRRFVIIRKSQITLRRSPAILLMIHDIDEIKRAQNALSQANNQINLLNSITRHDILNRVMVVMSYSELLLEDISDPSLSTSLSRIHESGQDIRHLIDFTREYQDLGMQKPVWQEFGRLFQRNEVQNHLSGIILTLPEKQVEIYADPMLERVVYNLVENTCRHGQSVTEIVVSYQQQDTNLLIIYSDNGVGVPTGEKELIFKKGHGKNTGLGLFLIREVLAITGISISETGTPGSGARFEILVPAGFYRFSVSSVLE